MAAADRGPTARPKLARGRTDDAEQGSGRIHGKTCCCCGRRRDDGWTADGGGRCDGRADSARRTQIARTGGCLQQPDTRRAEWTAAATGADREDEDGKRKRHGQPDLRRADPAQTGGDEAGRRRIEAAQVDGRQRRCRRRRRAATGWTEALELLLLLRHYLKKMGLGGLDGGVAAPGREDRPSQGRRSGDRRGTTGSGISTVAVIPCYDWRRRGAVNYPFY
jgi:hypothetical protein